MNNKYIPDSVYTICETCENCNNCNNCSNLVYSPVVNGMVHDSQTGKVFCPFGFNGSMNQSIFGDQNSLRTNTSTTWGRAPQMDPRPLSKIGLTWRTS